MDVKFNSHLEFQFAQHWDILYPDIDLVHDAQIASVSALGTAYRYDFLQMDSRVTIEIQGAVWSPKAAHNSGGGIQRDYKKCNLAQIQGWSAFQLSEEMMTDEWIHRIADHVKSRLEVFNMLNAHPQNQP